MRIGSMTYKGYDNMMFMSGQTILECKDFAPFLGTCCKDCHKRERMVHANLSRATGLFIVRPPAPPGYEAEWMADFGLHICAHVCCHVVCRVVEMPHSWWVAKAKGLNTEEVWRLHTYGHKDGVAGFKEEAKPRRKGVTVRKRYDNDDDDELGGLDTWK